MRKKRDRLVERCRLLMSDGSKWTIQGMALALGCSECGASARIRDLRKTRYGKHKILKRSVGGIYEYWMVSKRRVKNEQ